MDYTYFKYYEFDFGSEWTRAKCLDTCELIRIRFYSVSVSVSNIWKFTN